MDFGEALNALKSGLRVRRTGWNGKDQWISLVSSKEYTQPKLSPDPITVEPCLWIRTQQGKYQPGWLASQSDMLAEDWEIVNDQ